MATNVAAPPSNHGVRVPHRALVPYVEPYVGYHHVLPADGIHHGLPSRSITTVVAFDEPLDVGWLSTPDDRGRYWILASGLHTEPAAIHHHGYQHGIQLALTPLGARALLGVPAAVLAAGMVPIEDLVGTTGTQMYDDLAGAASWGERFDALDRHLLRLLDRRRGNPLHEQRPEVCRVWSRLSQSNGSERVATLAEEVGWSRRHLSELFRAEFGLGVKEAARVMRFEESRRRLLGGAAGTADVAADCGYADQAHLTREWRDLAGYTPTEWRRAEFPFLQDLADDW